MRKSISLLLLFAVCCGGPAWGKCYFSVGADLLSGGRYYSIAPAYAFQLIPGDMVRVIFTDIDDGPCPSMLHAYIHNGDTLDPDCPMTVFVDQPGTYRFVSHTFGDTMAIALLEFEILPIDPTPVSVQITFRALLGGAMAVTTGAVPVMRIDLNQAGLLPASEPYSAMGFLVTQNEGMVADPAQFPGPLYTLSQVVDWVLLELRDVNDPATMLYSFPGVIFPNGNCVFNAVVPAGHYMVLLRHRNHLGILYAHPLPVSDHGINFDLRVPGHIHALTPHATTSTGHATMIPGNVIPDNTIRYLGAGNDRDAILNTLGGTVPTATVSGYHNADVNMDGHVKYVGANNDRDVILQVIGGTVPTNVVHQPLP